MLLSSTKLSSSWLLTMDTLEFIPRRSMLFWRVVAPTEYIKQSLLLLNLAVTVGMVLQFATIIMKAIRWGLGIE